MTLVSLQKSLPFNFEYKKQTPPYLYYEDVKVYQTDEYTFEVAGYSPYEKLPHRFHFLSDDDILAFLIPFLMQCIDGEPRV